MPKELKDIGASVRARLLQISKEKGRNFDLIMVHYVIERLLYRVSQSRHADTFILKGAMLLMTWFDEPLRRTRDLDLLGHGSPNPDAVLNVFKEILTQEQPDGVVFDSEATRVRQTRRNEVYGGVQIRAVANIAGARIVVPVDVGFGDAVEPPAQQLEYPVLLDMPAPRLRGYSRETVVAEKFQALIELGLANSRMKDYFDLWIIINTGEINRELLLRAIAATFSRRGTSVPCETPAGLSSAFANDPQKIQQWANYKNNLEIEPGELSCVVDALAAYLMPIANDARKNALSE